MLVAVSPSLIAAVRPWFEDPGDAPEVADVRVFAAGIEPENVASTRCAAAAGFAPDDPAPDGEGIVYWLLRRC
jgi:hypothetical protein